MRWVYWWGGWQLASQRHFFICSFLTGLPVQQPLMWKGTTCNYFRDIQFKYHNSPKLSRLASAIPLSPSECRNRQSGLQQLPRNSSSQLQLVNWNVKTLWTLITHAISYMPKTKFYFKDGIYYITIWKCFTNNTFNSLTALEVSSLNTYGQTHLPERFRVWSYGSIIFSV
jgi:hypothetical protein